MLIVARQNAKLCYLVAVKKVLEMNKGGGRKTLGIARCCVVLLLSVFASAFVCCGNQANGYAPILHPSIFWHNNQWETFENGQWAPYRGSANNYAALEPVEPTVPDMPQEPEMVDTNAYFAPYGWGFIGAPAFYHRPHYRSRTRVGLAHRRPVNGIGKPNVGLGRTTTGIGRPNVRIGQTTIGIGQPNAGIGQTTIGIGQPNVGIGRPNTGMGRTTIGIGQPNIGIGQPNVGIGQPNASIGQPTIGIGKTTIGIGRPMSGQQSHFEQARGR